MGLAARVVHDLFQMIGSHGADIGDVADDRHFALEYAQCHFHALGDIRHVEHASGHERARHDAAGPPAGVEPRGDGHARFEQVPGKQEEQGAVARKDDRGVLVGGERAAGAQQDVGPARAHDAGQRPAGEGTGRSMPPGATMMCEAASSSALPFMVHETLCGSSPQTVVPG